MKKPKIDVRLPHISIPDIATLKSKRNSPFLIASVLLLLAVTAGDIVLFQKNRDYQTVSKEENQRLVQRVDSLNSETVTCDRVVNEIGSQSADGYDIEAQRKLLELQLYCHSEQQNHNQALAAAQKLKILYESQNNAQAVRVMDMTIDNINQSRRRAE